MHDIFDEKFWRLYALFLAGLLAGNVIGHSITSKSEELKNTNLDNTCVMYFDDQAHLCKTSGETLGVYKDYFDEKYYYTKKGDKILFKDDDSFRYVDDFKKKDITKFVDSDIITQAKEGDLTEEELKELQNNITKIMQEKYNKKNK